MFKNLLFLFFCMCLLTDARAQQPLKTVYDQLVYVNSEWKNQPDVDPALKAKQAIPLSEQQLIQQHLQQVEVLLRKRTVNRLSLAQKESRVRNLNVLHHYWTTGSFPQNTMHSNRQPYFIDDFGTYCAVGYLMKESGAEAMAQSIHNSQNFSYLADIQHPDLMSWVQKSGLSFQELALIQPGYGGEWPAAITEMHYNNIGTDVNEYLEVHQSNGGLIGMLPFSRLELLNSAGVVYKTLTPAQMQAIGTFYYYQFPSSESFADSGKIVLYGPSSNSQDTTFIYTYNSTGITIRSFPRGTGSSSLLPTRTFTVVESEATPVGSSLTFCGIYNTTWSSNILPATVGTVNPCTVGALPISLLSFDYIVKNNSIQLNWKTASETNNSYFEVQRSSDGIHFTALSKIAGAGTSNTTNSYSYTDNTPVYLNHYRLRQVDKDGKESFSKILFVKMAKASPLVVLQNPVTSTLYLQINSLQDGEGRIVVYDMIGRTLLQQKAVTGSQQLSVASLSKGKYIVRLYTGQGDMYSQSFVK